MKRPIEKLLKQMSLVPPPDTLDELPVPASAPGIGARPPRFDGPSWWTVGVAAIAGSLAGVIAGASIYANRSLDATFASNRPAPVADRDKPIRPTLPPRDHSVQLTNEGLFLLNGKHPVRKYSAMTWRRFKSVDADSGQTIEIDVPIRQIIVAPSTGT